MRTTEAPVPDLYPMHAGRDSGHPGMSAELFTARYFQHAAHVRGDPPLDWRLIQDAEANAREIATHARVPGPPAGRTPDTRRRRRRGGPWPADRCGRARADSRNRSRRATAPGNAGPHSNEGLRATAVRN